MIVGIIDYGAGNVSSVARALDTLGAELVVAVCPSDLRVVDAIVLPGVGHFGALVRALDGRELRAPLLQAIVSGMPFLGICLGLQALYSSSEEAPALAGLDLFPGVVRSLPATVKLPHMGWNTLQVHLSSPLLEGIGAEDHFYFAHSFAVLGSTSRSPEVVATCEHGAPFVAVAQRGCVFATQFHPEKSGGAGARLLDNYLRFAREKNRMSTNA